MCDTRRRPLCNVSAHLIIILIVSIVVIVIGSAIAVLAADVIVLVSGCQASFTELARGAQMRLVARK